VSESRNVKHIYTFSSTSLYVKIIISTLTTEINSISLIFQLQSEWRWRKISTEWFSFCYLSSFDTYIHKCVHLKWIYNVYLNTCITFPFLYSYDIIHILTNIVPMREAKKQEEKEVQRYKNSRVPSCEFQKRDIRRK